MAVPPNVKPSSISNEDNIKQLLAYIAQKAIVRTLFMPTDPAHAELFSDKEAVLCGKPFLLEQVLDHDGKSIEWEWRANRYADYLLDN